jgi:hypothetical protein
MNYVLYVYVCVDGCVHVCELFIFCFMNYVLYVYVCVDGCVHVCVNCSFSVS